VTNDVIVVGAGLAGLAAALRLAEKGRRVLLLAQGVGATHLAPGTIDVLGYAPGRVESPARALPELTAAHPEHPYARVTSAAIAASVDWLKARLGVCGFIGGLEENFLLPSAVGVPKPSAVVQETMAGGDLRSGGKLAIAGFRAVKDFYPRYLADNLSRAELPGGATVAARALELALPLDGEVDVGTLTLARRFEEPRFRKALVADLSPRLEPDESVGLPAVLGLQDSGSVWRELEDRLETRVFEIPTLPPSVPGIRVFRAFEQAIREAGGRVAIGGKVAGAVAERGRLESVAVESAARPVTYRARSFVLASGGFASGGLELDSRGAVRETVFDLPVAGLPGAGEPLFEPGYLEPHALSRVGVAADERLRPVDDAGRPVYENLHAAGATLQGAEPWREASGNGISLASGYAAATAILEGER
jgi:glycerol-3-phosphate dehydrogenase subunit B